MTRYGYFLSCEEYGPSELVRQATSLPVTTAVTCPLVRQHPAIVAQAAATSALLTGSKFTLGVGTGEALNEHILGGRWPSAEGRLEMLEEAVHVSTLRARSRCPHERRARLHRGWVR